jgi:hypothetical protein
MKKLFVMLITAGCFAGFNANAQATDVSMDTSKVNVSPEEPNRDTYNSTVAIEKNDLIKIRISELPAMVSQTLGNSDYTDWTIVSAYRTKESDQYLVDVKKGSQTRSYWFDKNGNRLENRNATHKSGNGTGKTGTGTSGTSESGTAPTDK